MENQPFPPGHGTMYALGNSLSRACKKSRERPWAGQSGEKTTHEVGLGGREDNSWFSLHIHSGHWPQQKLNSSRRLPEARDLYKGPDLVESDFLQARVLGPAGYQARGFSQSQAPFLTSSAFTVF